MASPNLSELAATTIEHRSKRLADIVSNNTALLMRLKQRGKIRTFSGGTKILEEFSYAENSSFNWYSGYDTLNIRPSQVISAAEYAMRLCSVAVTMSGEEMLKNAGMERQIDLLQSRIMNAEQTMTNKLSDGLYSDGTAYQGRQIDGLNLLVPTSPNTGTAGGVNRATWSFWRSQYSGSNSDADDPRAKILEEYVQLCRNREKPDLGIMDNDMWVNFNSQLQEQQRYMSAGMADMGFPSVKFHGMDVLLDGGIRGDAPSKTMFLLNTNYIFWRPHSQRNMVSMGANRQPINQDVTITLLGFAGNLTASNLQMQGRINWS